MKFTCTINGSHLDCEVTTDRHISQPVLCTSAIAPLIVLTGETVLATVGGYIEVQLPDLLPLQPYAFSLAYASFQPANRAWMPLGAYLRTVTDKAIPLSHNHAGFQPLHPSHPTPAKGLKLIPLPTDWQPTGAIISVKSFESNQGAMQTVAELAKRQNIATFLSTSGTPVVFETCDLPSDAYRIHISPSTIMVQAADAGGQLYGSITLLLLLALHQGEIPCGTIIDIPRFPWRGQHLDCARHFYNPTTLYDLFDLMALLKLNRFHWHFADDEAFRIQIDSLPELWQKTAMRGEGHLIPAVFSADAQTGGSYSKTEVNALIAHAKRLNIEIMPEIEAPAHALAITQVFPETRDPNDTGTALSIQGYRANVLNPAMPKTWQVLNAIVTEISELFPFDIMHLGGDELPTDTWAKSPAAKALMETLNLSTSQDLFAWTMARLAQTATRCGKRPAAWEEAAQGMQGGIGHNAILFNWTTTGAGLLAAQAGYDVVMTPAQHVYLDMAHSDSQHDWGANWAAYVALEDTVTWDPIPADNPELAQRIIGVQGGFWSEFTTHDAQLWPMLMPRILGIAAQAWQSTPITTKQLQGLANDFCDMWRQ